MTVADAVLLLADLHSIILDLKQIGKDIIDGLVKFTFHSFRFELGFPKIFHCSNEHLHSTLLDLNTLP